MKRKIILTMVFAIFLVSNAAAEIEFGEIQVNDSHIETGETVEMSIDVTTSNLNEGIVGVDAKYNSWMEWEEYGHCDGDGSCTASWTFTPYSTGEKTLQVRGLSDYMTRYANAEPKTVTVHDDTEPQRDVSFTNIPDNMKAGEGPYSIEAQASDSSGGLYAKRFVLEERKDLGGLGWGNWEEFGSNWCWGDGQDCTVEDDFNPEDSGTYQLKASVELDGGEVISERTTVTVDEAESPSVEISNIRSTDENIEEGDSTRFKVNLRPNQDVGYLEITFKSGGQEIITEQAFNLNGGEQQTVTTESLSWDDLEDQFSTGQDHDLEVEVSNNDISNSRTNSNAFFLAEADEEEDPSVDISNIRSTYENINEGESTRFKVDLRPTQDIGYAEVKFKSGGETLITEQVDNLQSGQENTVSSESLNWDSLKDQLSTGQDHDLEVKVTNYQLSNSRTANDVFFLAEAEETDVEITNIRSTDENIEEGESTRFKVDLRPSEDISYLEVTFRSGGNELFTQEVDISANQENTVTSDSLSWSDLKDQLSKGQDHDLTVEISNYQIEDSATENDAFFLAEAEGEEQDVELESVSASDYRVSSGEETELRATVKNNEQHSSYVRITWKADGTVIANEWESISADSTETVRKDIDYSTLRDKGLSTGQNYDLEGRLRFNSIDVTDTASEGLYLVPRDDGDQRMEIKDLWSTNNYVEEDESTDFKVRLEANEDVSYVEVDFYVEGEKVRENSLENLDSGETITVSSTLSWDDLEAEFDTGQHHDLEVRVSNYQIDLSRTENNEFYLAGADEDPSCEEFSDSELDVDLENFESIPVEGNSYDSTAKLVNNGNRDVGGNLGLYIKESSELPNCDFYSDHFDDLVGFTGGNVYPDAGESDSFSFSYSGNPVDDLEYGETYHIVAVFNSDSTVYVGSAGAIQWQRADEGDSEPTARFSWDDHPAVVGKSVRFDASASSDPDSDIEEYRWNFDDGTGYRYGEIERHTFSSTGTYDVELRVEDSNGNTDFRTKTVTVEEQPGECRVNVGQLRLGDDFIEEGSSTTASVTLSNNGDKAQRFEVKFMVSGDTVRTVDRTVSGESSRTVSASVSPDQDSLITAKADTEGEPCGDQTFYRYKNIDVYPDDDDGGEGGEEDREPHASFTWSPGQPYPDETVTFDASSSRDPDNDIVDYTWYFGDGTTGNGRTVDHSFSSTGDYSVQLVVEDSQGNTDTQVRTVPVVRDPEACSYQVSGIRFGDDFIERGTSTSASVTVSNLGERQAFEVKFTDSGDHVETENVVVAANSQRTVSTTISPDKDSLIGAKVTTDGDPCGQTEKQKYKEIDVYSGEQEQDPTLNVNVYDRDGRRLYNARVNVEGPTSLTRYTDSGGESFFELQEGNYDVTVSKPGYSTEHRTVNLERGDNSVITVRLGQQQQEGTLVALVEDSEGNRLSNAEVTAENGERQIRDTGNNGRAVMNLEEGTYTVTAEKSGYGSRTKTVDVEEGQQTTEVFRLFDSGEGLQVTDVQSPSSVCRGDTMRAQVTIENNGGYHEVVSLTGSGLGGITAIGSFSLEAGETVTRTLYFTNVQGSGSEQFRVTVNNQNDYTTQRSVQVNSCGTTEGGQASDISLAIDYTKTPKMAVAGDFVKVSGFVDGATGRSNVEISVDDEVKAAVRTQPDGYYQTWITAEDVGPQTVTASTGDVSDSKPLRIIPTSDVSNLRAPVSQFEGQTFQICATVESQIEPEVVLVRDGKIVQSKKQSGEVCFEQEAREPGMHQYKVAALTSGRSNTASTTVEVLEMGVEASSFPNQIASVESGSGLVKVDLYNTNDGQTRYDLALEGLPGTWVSQSEKQVVLDKGERRTVYFYLTPQEEGSYRPTITVDSRGTEIYREELSVITGGTTDSNPKEEEDQEGFFGQVWKGVTGFLSF